MVNYIPIRSYDNYVNANLELALLREAGINCHIKDEYTITIDPLLSPALGGMKLMVEEAGYSKALKLLEESDELYLQSIPCPFCRHRSLQLITKTTQYHTWIGKIKSLLVNGQEQQVKKFYRCSNCGHELTELPQTV